jgi:hypothetical protein
MYNATNKRANMFKRNQIIIIRANERSYTQPRLAQVKSVRKDGSLNCVIYLYKHSNIASDYLIPQEEIAASVVGPAVLDPKHFRNLACSFGNQDPNDPFVQKQQQLDAQYPAYAAMRNNYGPYESISEGIARLKAAA